MSFLVLGLSHESAGIALRERLALPKSEIPALSKRLAAEVGISEVVILSTCNRTEIYCNAKDSQNLILWLCRYCQIDAAELQDIWYVYHDEAAMRHLVRVAAGLDSMMLGEPQIFGQVKDAYQLAQEHQAVLTQLNKIFQHAFYLAKKVRSETDIGKNAISVAYAAVGLAKHIFAQLKNTKIIFIGAGDTISLVAEHFKQQQAKAFYFVNRTLDNAAVLAEKFDGAAFALPEFETLLPADIIVTATESRTPLVTYDMISRLVLGRREQPLLLLDLAVPRNIEEKINTLPDCYLYSIDDLQLLIKENLEQRRTQAKLADEIIDAEIKSFFKAQRVQSMGDKIYAFTTVHDATTQELLSQLKEVPEYANVMLLIEKYSKKLQHQAIQFLKDNL